MPSANAFEILNYFYKALYEYDDVRFKFMLILNVQISFHVIHIPVSLYGLL